MPKLHLTSQIWYCAWDLCCSEHGLKRKTHRLCANVAVFNHIGIPNNFSNFSLKRCQGFLGLQGGEKQNKTKQRRQQLAKAENWTHPHLSRSSIRDTGNHCSAGNVFHARFAQGTNTFAKIDMSPYNQYVACQLACILKQFYGVNSNSLTSSYYVKIFFFHFMWEKLHRQVSRSLTADLYLYWVHHKPQASAQLPSCVHIQHNCPKQNVLNTSSQQISFAFPPPGSASVTLSTLLAHHWQVLGYLKRQDSCRRCL